MDSLFQKLTGATTEKYFVDAPKPDATATQRLAPIAAFIPSWHEAINYDSKFFDKAVKLLKQVSLEDLARYLKVVGFEKIQVDKDEAAELIAAMIIKAKSEDQYMDKTTDKTALEYLQCHKSSFADIISGSGDRSKHLREILCCMEGRYAELKTEAEKKYKAACDADAACAADKKLKPVFGLSSTSDCGPMLYKPDGQDVCSQIPELMVAVLKDREEKSIAEGRDIVKNIFLSQVNIGKEPAAEVEFTFQIVAYLQYKTYTKLKKDLHQMLTLPVSTKSVRFFEFEEPGAVLGKQAVLSALKKITGSLLADGRLSSGHLRHARAFVAFGRSKPVDEIVDGKSTTVTKTVLIPVETDAEHLALWYASHLTMLFDAAKLIKKILVKRILKTCDPNTDIVTAEGDVSRAVTAVDAAYVDVNTKLKAHIKAVADLEEAKKKGATTTSEEAIVSSAESGLNSAKANWEQKVEELKSKREALKKAKKTKANEKFLTLQSEDKTICQLYSGVFETVSGSSTTAKGVFTANISSVWDEAIKENHDLIASVVLDGLKTVKAIKETDGFAEAATILTHVVKNALDDAAGFLFHKLSFTKIKDLAAKLNLEEHIKQLPHFYSSEDDTEDYLLDHFPVSA